MEPTAHPPIQFPGGGPSAKPAGGSALPSSMPPTSLMNGGPHFSGNTNLHHQHINHAAGHSVARPGGGFPPANVATLHGGVVPVTRPMFGPPTQIPSVAPSYSLSPVLLGLNSNTSQPMAQPSPPTTQTCSSSKKKEKRHHRHRHHHRHRRHSSSSEGEEPHGGGESASTSTRQPPKLEVIKCFGIEMPVKCEIIHHRPRASALLEDSEVTWTTAGIDIKLIGTSGVFHEWVRYEIREHLWDVMNGAQFRWKDDPVRKGLKQETREEIEKAATKWPVFKKVNLAAPEPTRIELPENPDLMVVAGWIAAEVNGFLHNPTAPYDYGFQVHSVKLVDNKGLYGEANVIRYHY